MATAHLWSTHLDHLDANHSARNGVVTWSHKVLSKSAFARTPVSPDLREEGDGPWTSLDGPGCVVVEFLHTIKTAGAAIGLWTEEVESASGHTWSAFRQSGNPADPACELFSSVFGFAQCINGGRRSFQLSAHLKLMAQQLNRSGASPGMRQRAQRAHVAEWQWPIRALEEWHWPQGYWRPANASMVQEGDGHRVGDKFTWLSVYEDVFVPLRAVPGCRVVTATVCETSALSTQWKLHQCKYDPPSHCGHTHAARRA